MQNILFTHSYFLRLDPKQWKIGQPYAPLGTLYAASLIRENGFNVSFFDTMFCYHPNEILFALNKKTPEVFVIYDDGFNYLTKMCLSNMREAAFKLIQIAKDKGCIVIISSSDSTDHFEEYLKFGVDFVLIGEAEFTLLELLTSLRSKENNFSQIQSIAFLQDKNIVKTQRRSVIKNLDTLPLPAWDMIDIAPYQRSWIKHAGYFSINVATTRGCPFKCNWCAKPIYGNRYNSRSPENVIRELKLLKENYQFDHIWFCDDIFGLKPGWVNDFAVLAEEENLQFKFKIQSRADLLVQEDYVKALAYAGCENVWMGAESGSQKILDAMDKGITVEQIADAVKLLKQHGIKASFFIQFGYLGETKTDIILTVKMINKLLPYEIGISVSYPLPGTIFFEKVKLQLKVKTNWTDSDEMALLFKNAYQPAFYKQLPKYVHKSYRKHLAFDSLLHLCFNPFKTDFITFKKAISSLYYLPAAFIEKIKLKRLEKIII